MRLKSYYTDSVESAVSRAGSELGPEALLLFSRPSRPEDRHLGSNEVVFASGAAGVPAKVREEIATLERRLADPLPFRGPVAAPVPGNRAQMIRQVRTEASFRAAPGRPSVVIFAGPAGSGKTSAAVKCASRLILRQHPAPLFWSLDHRVGGGEPFQSYANALGCEYERFLDAGDVAARIRGLSTETTVFVDTPGAARYEGLPFRMLESLREAAGWAELQLVLSAEAKAADLSHTVERFRRLRPTKLLFTRLDETCTYGPLWSEAVRWNLPVSFLSFGPGIPEDLEPATAVRLVDLALTPGHQWLEGRRKAAAASAG